MTILSALVFCLLVINSQSVPGQTELSEPRKVRDLVGHETLDISQISPGNDRRFSVEMRNPYQAEMENITFTVEVYRFSDLDRTVNISELRDKPVLTSQEDEKENDKNRAVRNLEELEPNQTEGLRYSIKTSEETPRGTYSLRFKIVFDYGSGNRTVMKSRGYFSDSEFEDSLERSGPGDEEYFVGNVNITYLGVDGILPETTFMVREQTPRWPQYLLGFFTVLFGGLAVIFYLHEEHGYFPGLEDRLEDWSSKLDEAGRRLYGGPGDP